jgi:hypothetical protein
VEGVGPGNRDFLGLEMARSEIKKRYIGGFMYMSFFLLFWAQMAMSVTECSPFPATNCCEEKGCMGEVGGGGVTGT